MASKPVSTMVRYCGSVVDGGYCNAELLRSDGKIDGHYEGTCPDCGSFYTNYNGRPKEPKTGEPSASQITAAKNKAQQVKDEMAKLRKTYKDASEYELTVIACKNLAYEAKAQRKAANMAKAKTRGVVSKASTTKKKAEPKAKTKTTTKPKTKTTTKAKSTQDTKPKKPKLTSADIDSTVLMEVLIEDGVLAELDEVLQETKAEEPSYDEIVWDSMPDDLLSFMPQQSVPTGGQFFGGSFEKRMAEEDEFPDILEEVEYETVVIKQPEPINKGLSDDLIDEMWSDIFVKKHNLTAAQVKQLLSEETARLRSEKFILDDINFNPNKLSEDVILEQIRNDSLSSLMVCGKTKTQATVDEARRIKIERDVKIQQMNAEGLIKSREANKGLPYNFMSGVMTEDQTEEFMGFGIITKRNLKKVPPSPERLHSVVNRARIMSTVSKGVTKEIELETVIEYDELWKKICSDICNKEYGEHSYWIATGTDWFIMEYVNDVIKTAFATGLSVVPMVNLGELKEIFDKSHGYLNDMEFLANSPRAMRDSIERFTMFNAAYSAIYEGAVSIYKPKPLEHPRYTWGAYMQSDIVVVQLPEVGLVAGGIVVLGELLRDRAISGKSTILISTSSLKRLNELNTGLVPALFGQNGITVIPSKDVRPDTYLSPNTYIYHSTLEDKVTRASSVQKTKRKIEAKNKKK